ncbi:MAG TPA: HAD-IB family hydrolase [Acidimicrobiales bacterium]|nr:HAD-IB family hydrolase [Acidimicrobiales bacterium]
MSTLTETDAFERWPQPLDEAAFFDLDKTVIAKDAMAAFGGPLRKQGLLKGRPLAQVVLAQVIYLILGSNDRRLDRIRTAVLRLTKGWSRAEVVAIVNDALEGVVEPIIYDEAMDLIDDHHSAGRRVVIVSASPIEIVQPLGRHLGVDATIASEAAVDADGCYTGELAFYAAGPQKADAVRAYAAKTGVDLSRSFAYSDSLTDLPLLELVGHPVAVNPDRGLAKVAAERGWEVQSFIRPVRLRDRVRDRVRAVPPRPAIAIGTSTVVVGVGAAALGWWLHSRRHTAAVARPIRVV